MELNKIRIILDDSGSIDSLVTPVINQYATNYLVEVAFRNEYEDNRIYKVVFNINGKESPAKVLAPTDRYYDFDDGTRTAHFWEYKLTQYETQFYQKELTFSLIVENDVKVITTQEVSLTMNKQRFNKLTPVNLENDTSLNSVVYSISNLDKIIDSRINTSETEILEEVNRLDGVVRTDLTNRIMSEIDTVHTRIDGVEDYYNSEIVRIDTDINEKETNLRDEIINAVQSMTTYTDNTVNSYDSYAQETFLRKDNIDTEVYPYVDNKYDDSLKYTDDKIADLVGTAPETLDTLKEIADALKDQDDVITAIETTIGEKADRSELDGKVDKDTKNGWWVYGHQTDKEVQWRVDDGSLGAGSLPRYYTRPAEGATTSADTPSTIGGVLMSGEPLRPRHVATKNYVDTALDNKLDKRTTTGSGIRVYGFYGSTQTTVPVDSGGYREVSTLAKFNNEDTAAPVANRGYLTSSEPTKPGHCATKNYVDTTINGAVVEITDTAVTLDMNNNTEYRCTAETGITSLNITSFIAAPEGVAEEWSIIFKTGESITVEFPTNVKWAVAAPVFDPSKTYMITFIRFGEYYLGIWTVEA